MIGWRSRLAGWPVAVQSLMLVLVWVGLNRLVSLAAFARFPPKPAWPFNSGSLVAFWLFWFEDLGGGFSLVRRLMLVNLLLVVLLWLRFRALPRRGFGERVFQLVTYGGGAALLAWLQLFLVGLSSVEPGFRFLPLRLSGASP